MTAARAEASSLSASQIFASPTCRLSLTALSASGRLSVMTRKPPSALTSISSGMSYISVPQSKDPLRDDVLLNLAGTAHHALRAAIHIGPEHFFVIRPDRGQGSVPDRLLDPRHQQLVQRSL